MIKPLSIDPKLSEAYLWKGVTLRKANRNGEARQAFQKALELDPQESGPSSNWIKRRLAKMLRVPLLCLAIFAAAWLEFKVFPGHSYLEGDTQIYLPMLERMDAPGLLSRDLVATSPTLSLTAYDEATLLCMKPAASR